MPSADTLATESRSRNKVAFDVKTIREATTFEFAVRCLGSGLLGSLGAVGLLLAMIGLYGVVAYAVGSRTPAIGIRMALGASSHRVLWSVLGQGLRLVGLGVAVGTVLSLLMTRVIPDLVAGVSPTDPITFYRYGDRSGVDRPCGQLFPCATCDTDRPVDDLAQRVATLI
jgi:ABC-type antimicrobial peptide transport system permease subunit